MCHNANEETDEPCVLADEIQSDMKEKINSLRKKRITDIEKICTRKNEFWIETRKN